MDNHNRTYIAFLAPPVVILLILTVVPVTLLFAFAFTSWSLTTPGSLRFAGFANFVRMARDARALNSIRVTFFYIVVNTTIQMLLGFVIAFMLYARRQGTRLLRPLFLVPMLIPPIVVGLAWRVLFTPDLGGINSLLALAGAHGPDWLSKRTTALAAVTIASVWEWTPFVMLVLLAGLESLPIDPVESAMIDGASTLQLIVHVIVPLLGPIILIVVILRIIEALGILPVVFMMTGGGPAYATEAINLYAYEAGLGFLDVAYASSLLVVFVFIILVFSLTFIGRTMRGAR